ncbi:GNAT family N-acetyltransferase [Paenibacillus dendritiformis]|uniref:GNAT family N-acetyltransferase n=1 Tax=Paenibacillus dendritiformis TaxID=130049 RepID=UPI000DAA9176|nr:GNAT family N-acetyltransferase [Paenibacillus dendritiformis]PZM62431.1 GNAT family N-acetyltransferase [Paenibacillus dendritiformis]
MIIMETPRLFLRPFDDEDVASLHPVFSDPETMAYYPAPFSYQQTQAWIQRNQARYANDGYGLWAVCLKDSGQVIGDCGLINQNVDGKTEVEIGYHLNKAYWSKGCASEAAAACKEYGFERLGLSRLISIIAPQNAASIRVAERIGFSKEKEAFIFGKSHYIFSGSRPQRSKLLG